MNHYPEAWGRPRDDVYGAYNSFHLDGGAKQHTQSPAVTGTSVLAVRFKDGVVIAADNLASYGSLARFTGTKRLRRFGKDTVVGFGGDVSDMQYIDRLLNDLDIKENNDPSLDGLNGQNLHSWLGKLMYRRRTKMDPLWNALLVAGFDNDGRPFLSSTDLLGTKFSSPTLATGFGAHLAQPIFRRTVPDEEAAGALSRETAVELVRECMKVLFYRDARSTDRYSIAVVTRGEVVLDEDVQIENQSWAFAEGIRGYGTQVD